MRIVVTLLTACLAAGVWAQATPLDAEAARAAIVDLNKTWGKARVEYDRVQMDKMLAPDFFVQIGKQRISRKDFIDQNSAKRSAVLKRFDVSVLTVQPGDDGAWLAMITEKLEVEVTRPDGKKENIYSLWVTRDTWKPADGKWLALSSEGVGYEYWRGDKKPPAAAWGTA